MATPLQRDVKSFLSSTVKHGTHKRLAVAMDVTRGDISRRFSPNDEDRKCQIATCLEEAKYLCQVDPEAGESLRHYIDGLFESWLHPENPQQNITELACHVNRETQEFIEVRMKSRPADEQLKEVLDVVKAATHVARGLQVEIARKGAQMAQEPKRAHIREAGRR